jgi:hypothetical protein
MLTSSKKNYFALITLAVLLIWPKYVRSEFEAYLKCGRLEYGFFASTL